MIDLNLIQIIVSALLSSGVVGGIMALLSKKAWSPEAKNELAKIGSDFAQVLLNEARTEREELRATINRLESIIETNEAALERLERIAMEKDFVIQTFEERQLQVARKVQLGEKVSFYDIFGPGTPPEFIVTLKESTKGDVND